MRQKVILPYKLNLEICQLLDQWRCAVKDGETFRSFGNWVGQSYNEVCIEHWQAAVAEWSKPDRSDLPNETLGTRCARFPGWNPPGTYSDWLNQMAEDSFC